ncbi:MAG: hypothetical protein ACP5GI_03310 [Sulfolobales archaeon]
MISEVLLGIYALILVLLYMIYRRIDEGSAESRGYTEIFNREIRTISISARLKVIYVQLKLFLLRDSTIYVLILATLFFTIIMTWSIEPSTYSSREVVEGMDLNFAIVEGNYSKIPQLSSSRPILYVYEIFSEEPYIVKENETSNNILLLTNTIYLVECLDHDTILRLNRLLAEICEKQEIYVFGKELPSKGALIHGDRIFELSISSLISIDKPYVGPRIYTIYDLFNYKIYSLGPLNYVPRVVVVVNKDYASSIDLISPDDLWISRSIIHINFTESELRGLVNDLGREILKYGINQIVLVANNTTYTLSINYTNVILYSVASGVLTLIFTSGILMLYIKSFEENLVRYSESSLYSGGTDWISRTSLLVGYFIYSASIIFFSASLSSVISYLTRHAFYLGITQFTSIFLGSLAGALVSLIYLLRVVSESSIYHVEKLPTKTFLESKIQSKDESIERIMRDIIGSLEESEFIQLLEKHVNVTDSIGRVFLRAIYTYTVGVGVDIFIQINKYNETINISIDLDPWSIEELPPEALSSVSRLVLSRIQGILQSKTLYKV